METPNYYAIIPADVRYDKRLSMLERLLYGEITALSQKTGKCWATNAYFAELYEKQPTSISHNISNLAKYGHIEISVDKKEGNRRVISITINRKTYNDKSQDPIAINRNTPIAINRKRNNTSINNTSLIKESISEDRYQETPIPPLPPHSGLTSEHIIGVSPFGVSQDKNLSANNLVSKPSCDMKKDNTLFASRFDRFYSAYPKKKGKEGAKRAFMKLKADEGLLLQIIKAIEKQRQSPDWLKSNGDYIPYPSTWLNGKRWEDEDDSPNANSEGDYLPGYDWRKEEDKRMQREWEESKQRFQEGLRASGLDEPAYMAMLKAQAVENLRIEQKERERRNTTNANE